jgi:hypothetical protein
MYYKYCKFCLLITATAIQSFLSLSTIVVKRCIFQTKGLLTDLPQGVYCIDNDKIGNKPLLAVGSKSRIYLIKPEKEF